MVDIVKQLCVRSFEFTVRNGDHWKAEQGKEYTTTLWRYLVIIGCQLEKSILYL